MSVDDGRFGPLRARWLRFTDWLGIDRGQPVDLLDTDPVAHFKHWDRHLPHRFWG